MTQDEFIAIERECIDSWNVSFVFTWLRYICSLPFCLQKKVSLQVFEWSAKQDAELIKLSWRKFLRSSFYRSKSFIFSILASQSQKQRRTQKLSLGVVSWSRHGCVYCYCYLQRASWCCWFSINHSSSRARGSLWTTWKITNVGDGESLSNIHNDDSRMWS